MDAERLNQNINNLHKSVAELTLEEKIIAAALKRNPKRVTLQTDEEGNVLVDKNKNPEIYDWAVNG
ncbi:MAG: hypothetical protein FWD48_10930 [Oscillospiraceae bacterium]|nr:hypothetical protein [Oscillospiraceae bacterium]